MLKLFVFLTFAAYAAGLKPTICSNDDAHVNIYHVGTNSCACSPKNEGALRYQKKVLEICNGKEYVAVGGGGQAPAELGSKENPASSCKDIITARKSAKNGMYYVDIRHSVVQVYCHMDEICGTKGWTMLMKADGKKTTFKYDSALWSNQATFNPWAAAGGLDNQEAKLATYNTLAFNKLCLGMQSGGKRNWIGFFQTASSLHSLIADNKYRPTYMGRKKWKKLVEGSSLQKKCQKEGFNVHGDTGNKASIRIGIIGNEDNGCDLPDSRIGFGGDGDNCGQDASNSVGNEAACKSDNGDKHIKAMGYIFALTVKQPPLGTASNPAKSCVSIRGKSGVYFLNLGGQVVQTYCEMSSICGQKGWGMIMKLDGSKQTFKYGSGYWTDKKTYNAWDIKGGLNNKEAKLATYNLLPFENLCVGMRVGGNLKWLKIPYKANSLYNVIADGKYRQTSLGKKAWKSLIQGSSLQLNCNKEGFNVNDNASKTRIGIFSNNENDCNSPDSRLGFGGGGSSCKQRENNSVGNEATCSPDNGDQHIVAFGYIMAK